MLRRTNQDPTSKTRSGSDEDEDSKKVRGTSWMTIMLYFAMALLGAFSAVKVSKIVFSKPVNLSKLNDGGDGGPLSVNNLRATHPKPVVPVVNPPHHNNPSHPQHPQHNSLNPNDPQSIHDHSRIQKIHSKTHPNSNKPHNPYEHKGTRIKNM
ncbi:hypothetical protein TL16_g06471 [Triparma laevis f. inornata]|uniref:Uncharacterized protein n=1 Tax=Triparma laevis f. inornata TaxID=1714386 RepID=A0A9W7EFC2_9STRA|nr:hypothetical protein TL16_g06471 [Triparma laevis f. inornata]